MHTEIERKFIVTDSTFKQSAVRIMDIRQGYVGTSSNGEARVSIRDEKEWVIIKSNGCLARLEYEIPIPKKDAEELLSFTCDRVIHKTRYIIPCEDSMLKWEVDEFLGGDTMRINYEDKYNPYIKIETLEGTMKASVGDYIIKGVNGEFYPCKPDIFEKTYEEVAE